MIFDGAGDATPRHEERPIGAIHVVPLFQRVANLGGLRLAERVGEDLDYLGHPFPVGSDVDDGHDKQEAAGDEIRLHLTHVHGVIADVGHLWEGTEFFGLEKVLSKAVPFEIVETQPVREVFDMEPSRPLRDEVAKPWTAAFLGGERNNGACEKRHALDGVVKGDVKTVDDSFPGGVIWKGEAEDPL